MTTTTKRRGRLSPKTDWLGPGSDVEGLMGLRTRRALLPLVLAAAGVALVVYGDLHSDHVLRAGGFVIVIAGLVASIVVASSGH